MIEKQKKIEPKPIQELEIGVIETKVGPIEADIQPNSLQFRIEIKRTTALRRAMPFFAVLGLLLSLGALSLALRFNDELREETLIVVKQMSK